MPPSDLPQGSPNCVLEKRQPSCESLSIRTPTTSLKTHEVLTDGKTLKTPMTAAKRKQKSRLLKQLLANGINEVDASNMLSGDDSKIHSLPTQLQATLRNWLPNVNTGTCVPHSQRYRKDPEYHEKHLNRSRNRLLDPTLKLQNLKNVKKRLLDPDKKKKNLDNVRKRLLDPVSKCKNLANVKKRLLNPLKRLRNLQIARKRKADGNLLFLPPKTKRKCWRGTEVATGERNIHLRQSWFNWIDDNCLAFICTCCLQSRYRNQVQIVRNEFREKLSENDILRNALLSQKSVENEEWICLTCLKQLRQSKIPPESVLNGFDYRFIVPLLESLQFAEEKLVALRIPFMSILARPNGGQLACRGGIVNVP